MTRRPDPAAQLLRALARAAAATGCAAELRHEALVPWASATFNGGQHRVAVAGPALDAWLDTLADADLPLIGHFVASLAVDRDGAGAVLTVLVLED